MSHLAGPDIIELSSPYDSGPSVFDGGFHRRPRSKSASANYNPILTPQDEYEQSGSQGRDGKYVSSIDLGSRRLGEYGIDLLVEVILCICAVLVSAPFIWLAVKMARFHHKEVTESRSDFIKQATSTVCIP